MRHCFSYLLYFCSYLLIVGVSSGTTLRQVRIAGNAQEARLVLEFDQAFKYQLIPQGKNTYHIRLPQTKLLVSDLSKRLKNLPTTFHKLNFRKVNADLIVQCDVKTNALIKTYHLSNPERLLIVLTDKIKHKAAKVIQRTNRRPIKKVTKNAFKKTRSIVIVLDPGHGGKDPGAIGINGIREQTITLAIAQQIRNFLQQEPCFRVVLTRDNNRYLTLRQRLAVAHRQHADLFISIHADAYHKRTAHGASVFALSARGATSEAARWLAKRENESELGKELQNKNWLVRSILIDLARTVTIEESLILGEQILTALKKVATLHSPHVEQAAFVVLKALDIPSLLIEVGFVSHATEARKLVTVAYQKKLAQQIAQGIKRYFSVKLV